MIIGEYDALFYLLSLVSFTIYYKTTILELLVRDWSLVSKLSAYGNLIMLLADQVDELPLFNGGPFRANTQQPSAAHQGE